MFYPSATSRDRPTSGPAARWIELAGRISVCDRLFRRELDEQAARWQLSASELATLCTCHDTTTNALAQTEIVAILAASPAQVSGLVDRLRRRGVLQGRRAADDRRRQLWHLTPLGQEMLRDVLANLDDWARPLEDELGVEQSGALTWLLDRLVRVLHGHPCDDRPTRPMLVPWDAQAARPGANREGAA
ncbi:MAG: hypothetical protein A2V70_15545 [Planctomycetes bacterium RBG_13_63_9]|nr:MAG: hypothetical protein A2V70_15545 [Planctomycetes bacterium RBG_13_63_9]